MILIKHLIAAALLLAAFSYLHAEEPQPKTAWNNDSGMITEGSRYIFGHIVVPHDILIQMSAASEDLEIDPFALNAPKEDPKLLEIYPFVKTQNLPSCLRSHSTYRDISKLFRSNGITFKTTEWALLSTGLAGDQKLYFCATSSNTDLLEQIFSFRCGGIPHSFEINTTVVSTKNQGLDSKAWSMKKLIQQKPTIHARFGNHTRSGEKSSITLKSKTSKTQVAAEYELTLGENTQIYDARINTDCKLLEYSSIHLSQITAYSGQFKIPYIINCGTQGNDQRNYFLIMDTTFQIHPYSYPGLTILKRLDQIDGIYGMRNSADQKIAKNIQNPLETKTYRCEATFLQKLKQSNGAYAPHPIQITNIKESPHNHISDQIFDITSTLRNHGLTLQDHEYIHFNSTQHKIIAYGPPNTQQSIVASISNISSNIKMVRINAQIISVEHKGLETISWTMDQVKQSKPKLLTKYSNTGRSGERSMSGKLMHTYTTTDKETNKEVTHNEYEFETEPTIGESNQPIDLRLTLHSKPLGKEQITAKIVTAITLNDGKPTIIELGHPNNATRTHLLIINPDIITTDGTFYRNRFKPLEP